MAIVARGLCSRCYYRAKRAGTLPAPKRRVAATGGKGKGVSTRLAAAMRTLAEAPAKIEAEMNGLIADARGAVDAIGTLAQVVNAKNVALLKSLVKSRREILQLRSAAEEAAGGEGDGDEDAGA